MSDETTNSNQTAAPVVQGVVMLDQLACLAYHLYTLDALSRCTYPLRWSVLREDIQVDFYARAKQAYFDWHAGECEARAERTKRFRA